jgi:hypothetical protein
MTNNIQISGMGFLFSNNLAQANITNLSVQDCKVTPALLNNSKVFIKNNLSNNVNCGLNSFYNFPNCFPLTL